MKISTKRRRGSPACKFCQRRKIKVSILSSIWGDPCAHHSHSASAENRWTWITHRALGVSIGESHANIRLCRNLIRPRSSSGLPRPTQRALVCRAIHIKPCAPLPRLRIPDSRPPSRPLLRRRPLTCIIGHRRKYSILARWSITHHPSGMMPISTTASSGTKLCSRAGHHVGFFFIV